VTTQPFTSPFEVIDAHQHVGEPLVNVDEERFSMKGLDTSEEEISSRFAFMDAAGIHRAVVIPGHKYLRPNGLADTRTVNDDIAEYAARHPDRFAGALGVVEPRDGPWALPEIDRVASLGLRGISLHCRFQGVSLDNQWITGYVERMSEVGLVPFVHVVHESIDEALWKLCALAHRFPDTTFVALDAFAGFDGPRQCFYAADLHPNIVFDTALATQWQVVEDFVRRFGAQRVIFGSDMYSYRPLPHVLEELSRSTLTVNEQADICGRNIRRILGLPVETNTRKDRRP
jgi:predicted TIM-barrel fold metal-dependent hydrolase